MISLYVNGCEPVVGEWGLINYGELIDGEKVVSRRHRRQETRRQLVAARRVGHLNLRYSHAINYLREDEEPGLIAILYFQVT